MPGESVTVKPVYRRDKSDTWEKASLLPKPEVCSQMLCASALGIPGWVCLLYLEEDKMVHFVGAGPGAEDLITQRGAKLLGEADQVIYAGSLVNPELLKLCRAGFGNADDENWEAVEEGHTCRLKTFGIHHPADLMAVNIHYRNEKEFMGVAFDLKGTAEFSVDVNIPGLFSVYNALAAISVVLDIGVKQEAICQAMRTIAVNGRMELVYSSDRFSVIVDYAHNEVSMESLLTTLRNYHPKRLVSLFGCGGNRSRLRRYGMGEISGRLADFSIITADNSRFEAVEDIIADIEQGMAKTNGAHIEIPDRREAIRYAILNAQEGDVIVILGKGHEDYQEIRGVRYPFLDSQVAREALQEAGLL